MQGRTAGSSPEAARSAPSLPPATGRPRPSARSSAGRPSCATALALVLRAPVPMVILWGEDGVMLYNDAYAVVAGSRHPRIIGSRVRESWPEVASFNDNVLRVGLAGGTLAYRDEPMTLLRNGRPEQVWLTLDYSPIVDETGVPARRPRHRLRDHGQGPRRAQDPGRPRAPPPVLRPGAGDHGDPRRAGARLHPRQPRLPRPRRQPRHHRQADRRRRFPRSSSRASSPAPRQRARASRRLRRPRRRGSCCSAGRARSPRSASSTSSTSRSSTRPARSTASSSRATTSPSRSAPSSRSARARPASASSPRPRPSCSG